MKKIAVILSGCGNRDGSELQETLGLLLAIDRHEMAYQCFAPNGKFRVVSYIDGSGETGEQRDIYNESSRIARGDIKPIEDYNPADYDALALPGGMGAARNLSTYAFDGEGMQVRNDVEKAILDTHAAGKPIAAMCIAPMVLAKVLGPFGVRLTLGGLNDASNAASNMGAAVEICGPTDISVDEKNRVVTTPAYMASTHISQIFDGAENLVAQLVSWIS
ncbi:MAG: isoprenoid biosynthesis glyoxalase ElbB [Bacteroidales bacterium]|nr:isoprenoid biosynthesis glyoxalase ElbB [Bacteroidales bacterium]